VQLDTQLGEFTLAKVPQEAQRLERMGFDALWSFETSHDPFLPLAFAAQATTRLRIGTNIAVAFARTPMALAMTAWDLAEASGGRFMLGVGTQVRMHVERRFSATWGQPAARVKDFILCMRAIWDCWQNGTKPAYAGPFYQFKLMTPFFNPGPIRQPRIPVYLAGVNPTMGRTGGEVADGFHVHPMHSVRYLKEVLRPAIDEGAKTRGKRVADLELTAPVFVVTGETPEETRKVERMVKEQLAFYASTPNYRGVLDLHGWTAAGEALSQKVRSGDFASLAEGVSDEMLDAFAIVAPPERVPQALRQRYEGLVQRTSVYFPVPKADPEAKWKAFVDAFRKAG
jgi:probable F420-dependent oxidoreductase